MVNNEVIVIEKSGHHLDLRTPNVADPPSVTDARAKEFKLITGYIEDYQN
jgi:lysosomal Pro-X carboxypeptidase